MRPAMSFPAFGCPAGPRRACGICRSLSAADRLSLRVAGRSLAAGQDVFSQGEECGEVFTIVEGWVFLYELLEDGRRQILQFGLPGDFIGLRPGGRPSGFGAQAIGPVRLCVMPRHQLLELARRRPQLACDLLGIFARGEAQTYERLTALGRKTALERVATLLLELFCRIRRRAPDMAGEILRLPLTQIHIADALGLTPVHVSRTLGVLRQAGILAFGGGTFRILAPDRLVAIAGIDADTCPWPGTVEDGRGTIAVPDRP